MALLFGLAFAGTGWLLVNHMRQDAAAALAKASADRVSFARSMVNADIAAAALRMQEISGLPLLSEYLDLAATHPDSVDAAELNAYLVDVLGAAARELGAAELTVMTLAGTVLVTTGPVTADNQAENSTPHDGTSAVPSGDQYSGVLLLASPDGGTQLIWRQVVPSFNNPGKAAGMLLMRFARDRFDTLNRLGLTLRMPTRDTAATEQPSGDARSSVDVVASSPVTEPAYLALRLFTLAGGFLAFLAVLRFGPLFRGRLF